MKQVFGSLLILWMLSGSLFAAPAVEGDPQGLLAKVEQAERNQQAILRQLAELKEELYVVKVRVRQRTKRQ